MQFFTGWFCSSLPRQPAGSEKGMPCRMVDPVIEGDAPAAAGVLLSLSIACWAGRMDPDVMQHGPLLALTFKPRQQHIEFPLTVTLKVGKQHTTKQRQLEAKDKSEIA